jgi:hypothetical protein
MTNIEILVSGGYNINKVDAHGLKTTRIARMDAHGLKIAKIAITISIFYILSYLMCIRFHFVALNFLCMCLTFESLKPN